MAVASHPLPDEKLMADAMQLSGGGPAANAAVCVARLGGEAGFCGYLGQDLFAQAHVQELIAAGVDISCLVRGDASSPLSQVLAKSDGSRSVVNFKRNTPVLAADAVALTERPAVLLCDGHEPLLSVSLCQWAKAHGVITVLDAGSLHQGTLALMEEVDYLVASERFSRQYSGATDVSAGLDVLSRQNRHVVITLGVKGLICCVNGARGELPAFPVTAVDSTGAGDAFHGAFALGLARGMAGLELLRFASAAGALACTALGARPALPDRIAVEALLASHHA